MVWADQGKRCDYCGDTGSIWEMLTEFGKYYHERCYIHRMQKEIEGYKKKWINQTLTDGDKVDLVDKYNLVQKLKVEKTEFRGFMPIGEFKSETPAITERLALSPGSGEVMVDKNGFPVFVEVKSPSVSMRLLKMRPSVAKVKSLIKVRQLTVQDIPQLMEALP